MKNHGSKLTVNQNGAKAPRIKQDGDKKDLSIGSSFRLRAQIEMIQILESDLKWFDS